MTREEFKMAFDEAMAHEFEFLENIPEHEFSARFERKMRRIFRRANYKNGIFNMTASKRFLAMAASFLIVCICTMQVDAISAPIIKLINTVYDKFNLITYDSHSTHDYITCEYKLTYVPDDFVVARHTKGTASIFTEYSNETDDIIKLLQKTIKHDSQGYLDNEQGTVNTLNISNMDVIIYTSDSSIIALWIQDNYNIELSWIGDYNEAEFIRMIESVRAVEPDASAAATTATSTE